MDGAIRLLSNFIKKEETIYLFWMLFVGMALAFASYVANPLFAIVPFIFLFATWVIKDYSNVFYLFFLLLPFSIEYNFTPSLGTDLPSEPLMWIMLGISLLLFCLRWRNLKSSRYFNAITFALSIHISWFFISTVLSEEINLSFKVFLAKVWYVIPFYFMSIHILKDRSNVEKMIKSGIFTLAIAILIVLYRHSLKDFAFEEANFVVMPIFRNHVNYACIIVIFLPYLWTLYTWEKGSTKSIYLVMMLVYLAGIYFSYTRAAILAVILSIFVFYIIKWKMIKPVLLASLLVGTLGISYLMYNNNYLRMNPSYEKAISHNQFDKLLTATYKMEDISTMERVYRWVAGVEMIKDKPLFGFGPGTFYTFYSGYTISAFQTYVSDNPDHSTVHCYYLLTFIEQGLVGFIILIIMVAIVLVFGERKYHKLKDKKDKAIIMAAMLSFIIILLLNLINDMIETDKVGPFFFLAMALIGGYKTEEMDGSVQK
jgi:O-antigen ligase